MKVNEIFTTKIQLFREKTNVEVRGGEWWNRGVDGVFVSSPDIRQQETGVIMKPAGSSIYSSWNGSVGIDASAGLRCKHRLKITEKKTAHRSAFFLKEIFLTQIRSNATGVVFRCPLEPSWRCCFVILAVGSLLSVSESCSYPQSTEVSHSKGFQFRKRLDPLYPWTKPP